MKKRVITALLISVIGMQAFAGGIEEEYEKALIAYKAKDFSTSYEILSKLYLTKLSDVDLSYQLGRSAYETGHYEIALAAFERVDMLDNGNIKNKLEMARTYFVLKMYEESEIAFKEVLQNQSIPENVRTNIEYYLAKVSKVQQKSFTYATFGVDYVYDSNINYGSLDSTYQINGLTLPTQNEKDGSAFQVYGDIVNIYDIGDKNGFAIKNKLSGYVKHYTNRDNSDYDIDYLIYNPSLVYKETKYTAELEAGLDTLSLAGHTYLRSYSLSPKIEWNHSTTLRSLAYFKYADKVYKRDLQKDLDANHYELSYSLQKILTPSSYLQGSLVGMKESRKHGKRVDVNYNEYQFNVNYANQFTPRFGLELYGVYRARHYNDFNNIFGSKREDNGGIVSTTFNVQILSSLRFRIKTMYEKVDSKQNIYSYDKTTVTVGFVKTF